MKILLVKKSRKAPKKVANVSVDIVASQVNPRLAVSLILIANLLNFPLKNSSHTQSKGP